MGDGNSSAAKPFVFSPSQAWDGNDGRWSTFIVRVGTPEQNFRILPGTSGQETLLPVPEGCTDSDPSNCGSLRGAYPFNGKDSSGFQVNASSTWKNIGIYTLVTEDDLGMNDNGLYGFDTVGLGLQNSGGITLQSQVIAGIATKNFYLGIFGLGPKPSNFSDFDYPQPTFMRTLKDQNKIPSLSFGYTAGAAYRIPKLPGSLTLGGYDASRFTSHSQTFPFNTDDSKVLSLGVQRITALNTPSGSRSFLNTPIYTLIDSNVPHLWLPREACDLFEQAFGLTYDSKTDLYLVNDTMHRKLQELQPTITFALGNDNNASKLVNIELPYGAFDLQASSPYYKNETNYFPIRRAANDTQYRLGRTFLQEAYIVADYERSNFSVYQTLFKSPMPDQNIITITTPLNGTNNTSTSSTKSKSGLPTPAIIGLAVGLAALFTILALFGFIYYRRRRNSAIPEEHVQITPVEMPTADKYELYHAPPEVQGTKGGFELDAKNLNLMSDDGARQHELSGIDARYEMPGEGEKLALRHEMAVEASPVLPPPSALPHGRGQDGGNPPEPLSGVISPLTHGSGSSPQSGVSPFSPQEVHERTHYGWHHRPMG